MNKQNYNPVLIVSATETEVEPLFKLSSELVEIHPHVFRINIDSQFLHILITGVGVPSATYEITRFLLMHKLPMAIQIGIAGSFNNKLLNGDVVMLTEDEFGDLGIEKNAIFSSLFESGYINKDQPPYLNGRLINNGSARVLFPEKLKKVRGLTVNLVTSNKDLILGRKNKFNAEVETMESAAFFYCCLETGTPFLSLRGISNRVGEEDRSKWLIREAVQNSCDVLIEILHKNNFFSNET